MSEETSTRTAAARTAPGQAEGGRPTARDGVSDGLERRADEGEGRETTTCGTTAPQAEEALKDIAAARPLAFSIVTMGCAKNEVDSREMRVRLEDAGCVQAADSADADLVVVNTCCFIQSATEESIQAVFDALGLDNVASGDAKVVVAGCMPARYGDELADSFDSDEAAAFVPCSKEDDIAQVAARLFPGRVDPMRKSGAGEHDAFGPSAYVKISDGCDRFCSYCAIPYIRGRYHSFTADQVAADVERAVEGGAREVVLIAQDTGRWGSDLVPKRSLASLMARLAEAHPDTWFRVMYLQPEGVDDELLRVMAGHDNICDYLDIPFQHADARILRAMNRRGSGEEYLRLLDHVRRAVPGVTLRSTFIVGFPGETDEDFDELCRFVEDAGLDYAGVFAYSREEGTRAARMEGQVDDDVKQERYQRLRDLADDVSAPVVASRVGKRAKVLVLGRDEDGRVYGRAQCQAPDVDGVTFVDDGKPGEVQDVVIGDALFYDMEAE